MKSRQKLILELEKLNKKLDTLGNNSRYMIYNANPFKFAWFNFIAGIFHSLGSLFGTVVIAAAVVYVLSQFNITKLFSQMIENSLNQIRWEKVVPTPFVQL